ncbi:RDD family protein [Halorubrum sp. DTA98]|uniref:RDD family protein n=1 Tax=Halorubrum sp. DTA98 TaxID=3402163 RepID=UPI003AABD088
MERPRPRLGTHTETLLPRIGAFIIDIVLVGIALGIVVGAISLVSDTLGVLFAGLSTIAFFAYFIYMEGTYGQTIGKRLLGIVVITEDGGDCDMRAAAIRNVLRIVDGAFGYLVGLVVILLTDDDQRVGDLVGDTVVARVE